MGRPKGSRNRNSVTIAREAEFRRLHAQGMTTGQIATAMGISASQAGRMRREYGLPVHRQNQKGEANRAWKGGRRFDKSGYELMYFPGHPYARRNTVRVHRAICEAVLGRWLLPHEVVDHIDGNKSNNHVHNLRVFQSNAQHLKETLKGRVPKWSQDGIERIRQAVIRSNAARSRRRTADGAHSP